MQALPVLRQPSMYSHGVLEVSSNAVPLDVLPTSLGDYSLELVRRMHDSWRCYPAVSSLFGQVGKHACMHASRGRRLARPAGLMLVGPACGACKVVRLEP